MQPKPHLDKSSAPEVEKLPANLPTSDQLIDNYVQALGGEAAIEKITSYEEKGTRTLDGKAVIIDIFLQDPERRASVRHLPTGDSMTVFNGHAGWSAKPGRPVRELHGADLDAAKMDADLHFPLHLKRMFDELHVEYPEKIGDREAYVELGTREGQPPVKLYFDEQSGLLLRLVRYAESPLGLVPTQIDYGDYRKVDGVETPFRRTVAKSGRSWTIQLEQVLPNAQIDSAKFAQPTASVAAPKPSAP